MPVHHAVALTGGYFDQPATARATTTLAGFGPVDRAMCGANDPVPGHVKKLVGLVIHLYRNMGTPVEVGMHGTLVSDRKTTAGLAAVQHVKWHGIALVHKIAAVAQGHRLRVEISHLHASPLSAVGAQPGAQLCHRVRNEERPQGLKTLRLMGTIADRDAGAAGIARHLQIMGGVADH